MFIMRYIFGSNQKHSKIYPKQTLQQKDVKEIFRIDRFDDINTIINQSIVSNNTNTFRYIPDTLKFDCVLLELLNEHPNEVINIPVPKGVSHSTFEACIHFIKYGILPQSNNINSRYSFTVEWDICMKFLGCSVKCVLNDSAFSLQDNDIDNKLFQSVIESNLHVQTLHKMVDTTNFKQYLINTNDTSFDISKYRVNINEDKCSVLYTKNTTIQSFDIYNSKTKLDSFFKTWNSFPWFDGETGIVLAGGFVVAASSSNIVLSDYIKNGGDMDFFLICRSNDEALVLIDKALKTIRRIYKWVQIKNANFKSCVTTISASTNAVHFDVKMQIIRVMYSSPYHVIMGFDVDICGMLYYPEGVFITNAAAYAISNKFNIYNSGKMSNTYEMRLVKYANRYGLGVLVPSIPLSMMDNVIGAYGNLIESSDDYKIKHDIVHLLKLMFFSNKQFDKVQKKKKVYWKFARDDYSNKISIANVIMSIFKMKVPSYWIIFKHDIARLSGSFFPVKADIYSRFFEMFC